MARAERQGALAHRAWHAAQKFLGAAQRDRNHHQTQRKPARQRRKPLERKHYYAVSKNSDYDRGHAVQQVSHIAHHEARRASAKFREVHATQKPNRHSYQRCQEQQFGAAKDRVGHSSASFPYRGGKFGEEVPLDTLSPEVQQASQNEKQKRHRHQRASSGKREHHAAYKLPPAEPQRHAAATELPRRDVSKISMRAIPF